MMIQRNSKLCDNQTIMSISFQAARRRLPEELLSRLQSEYSQPQMEKILRGFMEERHTVLRVNTLKTTVRDILEDLQKQAVQIQRIPVFPEAIILKNRRENWVESWSAYADGRIYLQGLSSQMPVLFLNPEPGDKVLDMTAAPGSKTTQIAASMNNQGEILANELNEIRHERLKFNLERQGVLIAQTRLGDGAQIGSEKPAYFDKILLDAPCSAEGRIQVSSGRSFAFWSEKNIREHAKLQRRLLRSAHEALKPGGILVYSTCTLAVEENEMMLDWFLKNYSDMTLQPLQLEFPHLLPVVTTDSLKPDTCIKAAPSNLCEGFFIAKMVKKA